MVAMNVGTTVVVQQTRNMHRCTILGGFNGAWYSSTSSRES